MARKPIIKKSFGVSVVGLSGHELDGLHIGAGKSCLCSRFMHPHTDSFSTEHSSVLCQTDFSGRVINNDHWLYWGETEKRTEDAVYSFRVAEHTEFVDDDGFKPFRTGKFESYTKRVAGMKLQSAEKLAYICEKQLGLECDYDEKFLSEGRFDVDGFVCVYDVSQVPQRPSGQQPEMVVDILKTITKLKKPVVLALTKMDKAVPLLVDEAGRLAQRKEFKNGIPVIETSAMENVNVERAFLQLAYLIEKNKAKHKIPPYLDGARHRRIEVNALRKAYESLVEDRFRVETLWPEAEKELTAYIDYQRFVKLEGTPKAKRIFLEHMQRLREDLVNRKRQEFLAILPQVLEALLPDSSYTASGDWFQCQQLIEQMPNFHEHFLPTNDMPWDEDDDSLFRDDRRIPFNFLTTPEAETCFRNHVNALHAERQRQNMKTQFRFALETEPRIFPGMSFESVAQLFRGHDCYEALSEQERRSVYLQRQNYLTEQSKIDFVELLQEHPDLFGSLEKHKRSPSPKQLQQIHMKLAQDQRYGALDRLQQTRDSVLLEYINFVHTQGNRCPLGDACVDIILTSVLLSKQNSSHDSLFSISQLQLAVLGCGGLAKELISLYQSEFPNGEFMNDRKSYLLEFKPIADDVRLPQNAIWSDNVRPNGLICCFDSLESMDFLRTSLEQTVLSEKSVVPYDVKTPIVILQGRNENLTDMNRNLIAVQGRNLAARLHCLFIDNSTESSHFGSPQLHSSLMEVVHSVSRRSLSSSALERTPDIRVLLCLCCGDPFPIDLVLSPLLNEVGSETNTDDAAIIIEVPFEDRKLRVQICIVSFHSAYHIRKDYHGYILVYSTKRYASFANMSSCIAQLPPTSCSLILAVTESGFSSSSSLSIDRSQELLAEGSRLGETLRTQFIATSANFRQQSGVFDSFFGEVWTNLTKAPLSPPIPQRLLPSPIHQKNQRLSSSVSLYSPNSTHGRPPPPPPRSRSKSGEPPPTPPPRRHVDDYQNIWIKQDNEEDLPPPRLNATNGGSLLKTSALKARFESGAVALSPPDVTLNTVQPEFSSKPKISPKPLNRDKFANVANVLDRIHTTGKKSPGSPVVGDKDWSSPDMTSQASSSGANSFSRPSHPLVDPRVRKDQYVFSDSETSSYERGNVTGTFSPQLRRRQEKRSLVPKRHNIPTVPLHPSDSEDSADDSNLRATFARGSNDDENFNMMRIASKSALRSRRSFRMRNRDKSKESIPFSDNESRSSSLLRHSKTFMSSDRDRQRRLPRATTEPNMKFRRSLSLGDDTAILPSPEDIPPPIPPKPEKKRSKETRRSKKKKRGKGNSLPATLESFELSERTGVPMLVEKCIYFIEQELHTEGLYRVPGNKSYVDDLLKRLIKHPDLDLKSLDTHVGTVATTLKTFFSDLPSPLVDEDLYNDLFALMSVPDKTERLMRMRTMLTDRMSPLSLRVLAYVIAHLSNVASYSEINCMNPQNLAIVWWPTLLRPNFTNLEEFNRQSSALQAAVQTWIENFKFFFSGHYSSS